MENTSTSAWLSKLVELMEHANQQEAYWIGYKKGLQAAIDHFPIRGTNEEAGEEKRTQREGEEGIQPNEEISNTSEPSTNNTRSKGVYTQAGNLHKANGPRPS